MSHFGLYLILTQNEPIFEPKKVKDKKMSLFQLREVFFEWSEWVSKLKYLAFLMEYQFYLKFTKNENCYNFLLQLFARHLKVDLDSQKVIF